MNIPEEVVSRMAEEIYKELEEEAKQFGKAITFDSMEKAVLLFRQRIGEMTMQQVVEERETQKQEKKTAQNAENLSQKKGTRKR